MINKFVFRKTLKDRGAYAEVSYKVSYSEKLPNEFVFSYSGDDRWKNCSVAAGDVFYDYFVRKMSGQLVVEIMEVKWLPVDTNNLIVFFTIVNALCEHFNLDLKNLRVDENFECFYFPEPRIY